MCGFLTIGEVDHDRLEGTPISRNLNAKYGTDQRL